MVRFVKMVIFSMIVYGCGNENTCPDTIADNNTRADPEDCKYYGSDDEKPAPSYKSLVIQGSVSGAFEVTVDGVAYQDMEEYYGYALKDLTNKVGALGYNGYEVKFEAAIGFKDLTDEMTVYVQTLGNRGFQGVTSVGSDNNFKIELPEDAAGEYQVRANKRIGIKLKKDNNYKSFCYNFSAKSVNVLFDNIQKPVILQDFFTSITQYSCSSEVEKDKLSPDVPKNR